MGAAVARAPRPWRCHHRAAHADDFVVGFQHRAEALRFRADLEERLGQHALSLHPDKTRLIAFGRYAAERRAERGLGKPETFNFLGFTHICAKSKKGKFQLRRKTRRKPLKAKLKEIKQELLRRRHEPVAEQGRWRNPGDWHRSCGATSPTTRCPPTARPWPPFAEMSNGVGCTRSGAEARMTGRPGRSSPSWPNTGYQKCESSVPGQLNASSSNTQGRSPLR